MTDRIILLVEDDANDEALTLRALKKAVPQVVLLDLNLPKVGGHDVLRAVRADARTRLIPVVVLTSSKQERDLTEGYNLGANSYVVKPVDFPQFSAAVAQLGLYWLLLNERPPIVSPSYSSVEK
jgi:two-component system response regulator